MLDHTESTFFYLRNFLKKLADDQCSSITKGSIYYIKGMYKQPFSMEMDWPEIGRFMEVTTVYYVCTYMRFYFVLQKMAKATCFCFWVG